MLSCDSYAMILRLKRMDPQTESGPLIVFVGVRLSEKTSLELHRYYATKHVLISPQDMGAINSSYASNFVFTNHSLQQQEPLEHLWRVAKEGATVYVLDGMKNGIVEPGELKNPEEYGISNYHGGLMSCWPYSQGTIRKDMAKYFHS